MIELQAGDEMTQKEHEQVRDTRRRFVERLAAIAVVAPVVAPVVLALKPAPAFGD